MIVGQDVLRVERRGNRDRERLRQPPYFWPRARRDHASAGDDNRPLRLPEGGERGRYRRWLGCWPERRVLAEALLEERLQVGLFLQCLGVAAADVEVHRA